MPTGLFHGPSRWLLGCALAASLLMTASVHAQDQTWVGKRIIPKQPGLKIGYSDDKGNQIYVAELTALAYTVLAERGGFLKVEHRGKSGWFLKTEAFLPDAAIKYFTERARINGPKDSTALAFLGWAYKENKDLAQALKHYDEAIKRKPSADWHNNRGAILLEMKELDRALVDFSEALRLVPTFDIALENRAKTAGYLKKTDAALSDWDEVLRRHPKHLEAYYARAMLHLDKKDVDAALLDLGKAIELHPGNAMLLIERGKVYADYRLNEKALDDFIEALKLAKDDPEQMAEAHFHKASVHTALKEPDKALTDLAETLRLAPQHVGALEAQGWNRFLVGNYEEASKDFEALIKAHPKDPSAYNCQAWLWATCPRKEFRDGKKALEYARMAVALSKEQEPVYLDTLAAALAELGRFDEAIETQERVVKEAVQDRELLTEAQGRLELYRKKQPYRQVVAK